MTEPQYEAIEQQLAFMRSTLEHVAQDDCEYIHFPDDRETPCSCNVCRAKAALRQSNEWRYQGAMAYRLGNGFNPREVRMISAFKKDIGDHRLSQILDENRQTDNQRLPAPSTRDWYVATSVVQWLATNCGMAVLERAGFKYTKWDEDKEQRDSK